jgi:hypothetical protein
MTFCCIWPTTQLKRPQVLYSNYLFCQLEGYNTTTFCFLPSCTLHFANRTLHMYEHRFKT